MKSLKPNLTTAFPWLLINETLRPESVSRKHSFFSGSMPMVLGCGIVLGIFVIALIGPSFASFSYTSLNAAAQLSPPDRVHWFGTDAFGRDLFSRVLQGLRTSLWISLTATAITTFAGISLGMLSGYYQGWTDQIISRLVDVLFALPSLLLAIVLIARVGPSLHALVFAIGVTGIPAFYRVTRNESLSITHQPFIEASLALGMSGWQVLLRHILPNIFPTLLVLISMRMGTYLLMGSGLSFIGLGVQPPEAELGALLATGRDYDQTAWWMIAFPGAFILATVLGFNLFGEGLRDQLDRFAGR